MGTNTPTTRDLVPGFAAMIIEAREALGLTRRELAEKCGLSFNSIYAIESEKRAPSLRVGAAIAKALGLKVLLAQLAKELPKSKK